ncbi:MAG: tRNA epoxyqueuosine(34) reductase QueG [Bernardetiaceae bacterium]
MPKPDARTDAFREQAYALGFSYVGFSEAGFLAEEAPRLERWLAQGKHGQMHWMEDHFDKRLDTRLLVPGAKTVISLAFNYFPKVEILHQRNNYRIAKYAYGKDYHRVLKKKLKKLIQFLQTTEGHPINGRAFVDSAPVMEKAWAVRGGIGWQGKNSNLITKQTGSFLFLCQIILDLEFVYDGPIRDYCGRCTLCLDACPTGAIPEPYVVDGSRCIAYLTIELKENIPSEFQGSWKNWAFGCDICQDVCPWNRRSLPHQEPAFAPKAELSAMQAKDWEELTETIFDQLFAGTALKRTKFAGLQRNIRFLSSSEG